MGITLRAGGLWREGPLSDVAAAQATPQNETEEGVRFAREQLYQKGCLLGHPVSRQVHQNG